MATNTKELVLQNTHKNLERLLQSKAAALPKGFNQTRFLQNCMTVLQDTYGIEKCSAISVARTMLKGAFLDLDFFNKECYAIPYGGQLQFQTDYKGEIKLALKYSINPIKDIYAKLVREGDIFDETIIQGQQTVNFTPKPFSNAPIIGAFAVVLFQDGRMIYETMSVEDMEKIKTNFAQKSSKTGEYSKAWTITTGEMYKKTVLRRLCKLIQLQFDSVEQKKAFDEASGMEVEQKPENEVSPLDYVEAEYQVEESDENESEPEQTKMDLLAEDK